MPNKTQEADEKPCDFDDTLLRSPATGQHPWYCGRLHGELDNTCVMTI